MSLGPIRAVGIGVIGLLSLYGAGKAMFSGVINIGGGRGRDFFVAYGQQPGVFLFAVLVLLAIGVGALVIMWKEFFGHNR